MLVILEIMKSLLFLTGYVSTQRSFPPQLTKSEEEHFLNLYADNGDDYAREKLIMHNMRLVAHISKKYAKNHFDFDDIVSIGTIGLVKAITTFRPERGNLATYASRCIENEILMFLRHEKKRSTSEISLDEPVGRDNDGNEVTVGERLCVDSAPVASDVNISVFRDKLNEAMEAVLTKRERSVIFMRYSIDGSRALTQREVADFLGVSRSYVSRIEKKALEKLAKAFSGSYDDWSFD